MQTHPQAPRTPEDPDVAESDLTLEELDGVAGGILPQSEMPAPDVDPLFDYAPNVDPRFDQVPDGTIESGPDTGPVWGV